MAFPQQFFFSIYFSRYLTCLQKEWFLIKLLETVQSLVFNMGSLLRSCTYGKRDAVQELQQIGVIDSTPSFESPSSKRQRNSALILVQAPTSEMTAPQNRVCEPQGFRREVGNPIFNRIEGQLQKLQECSPKTRTSCCPGLSWGGLKTTLCGRRGRIDS